MSAASSDYSAVLAHYPADCQPRAGSVEFLGSAGGFSGAAFWRFAAPRGRLCLRRWPAEHPTVERLQFIQAVLWHVHQEGFTSAPLPLETIRHKGFVPHAGTLWELAPWMPGQADYHARPSPERLRAAMSALARFHRAAASFPLPDATAQPSPGLADRCRQLDELRSGGFARLQNSVQPEIWPDLAGRAVVLMNLFSQAAPAIAADLQAALALRVRLVPCLRDIWHDHVLFEAEAVTALVDFGALRAECVAADISRLLGSLVADDADGWTMGLAAYQQVWPLSHEERTLVPVYDRTSVLLSGINWLDWIFCQKRQFSSPGSILARIDAHLARLKNLLRFG